MGTEAPKVKAKQIYEARDQEQSRRESPHVQLTIPLMGQQEQA